MKIIILILALALVGLVLYLKPISLPTSQVPPPASNFTPLPTQERNNLAGFGIYTNGTFRVFTNPRYHNKSEEIYIESKNPYIIHIKKEGATWGDFFKTLPMDLKHDCLIAGTGEKFCNGAQGTLKFYINEEKVEDFLNRKIEDGDRALITYGRETEDQIMLQMSKVVNPLP